MRVLQRAMLAQSHEMGLLGRVVNQLTDHPEADANEILIGWSDEGEQAQLIDFAKNPRPPVVMRGRKNCRMDLRDLLRQQQKLRQRQRAELKPRGMSKNTARHCCHAGCEAIAS